MYIEWNQSQIEPLEARSRQLLLKSCEQCFIVYHRLKSHVCNVSSRERIHNEAKKFNEEHPEAKMPELKVIKPDGHVKSVVVKQALASCLNEQHRVVVLSKINDLVLQVHKAIIIASRLMDHVLDQYTPLPLTFISSPHGNDYINTIPLRAQLVKQMITLVCGGSQTKDQWLNQVWQRDCKPQIPPDFSLPQLKELASTSHQHLATEYITNFSNYYKSTFVKRFG